MAMVFFRDDTRMAQRRVPGCCRLDRYVCSACSPSNLGIEYATASDNSADGKMERRSKGDKGLEKEGFMYIARRLATVGT